MTLLWVFELQTVARHNLYLGQLEASETMRDVELAIESFHATVRCRPGESLPL